MSFYEEDDRYMDEPMKSQGKPWSTIILGGLLSIIFAPAVGLGVAIFVVFMRKLKWRPHITTMLMTAIFMVLFLFRKGQFAKLALLAEFSRLSVNWPTIVSGYLYISALLGILIGLGIVYYKAFELKRYPEYVHLRGWAKNFEYVPTPLDLMRRKKNMKALKNGELFDYEKAPIGIIKEPVVNGDMERTLDVKNANKASVVYRYYTEAMAHTLITGSTGSGKALHKDTEIIAKDKGWTTVGEIKVGDIIYDESGNHTTVEAVYQPKVEDHYEITFGNGQTVKACGDHLWNIGDVNDEHTFATRDLYEHFDYRDRYIIKHEIDGDERVHEILRIKQIEDNPDDYYCFTVDSPSHLYLVTRTLIPTHNTVTMLNLIKNDVLAGHPICVIDFKKSPDFIYFLSKWAQENDREFYHFISGRPGTYKNPFKDNQATYDPLATGGATSKADMILNLRTWDASSEVFKKRTQDVLQSLFFLLERTPRNLVPEIEWDEGGLAQFVSALDLNNFKKMIEIMAKDMQAGSLSPGDVRRYNTLVDLYRELSSKSKSDIRAQIVELHSIARTLIVSNYGDWLAKGASDYHIDLMKIATSDKAPIVLFSFNQQEEPEFAEYIGSIVMSDLSRVSALKNAMGNSTKFGVYIDEFQTLDPRTVKDNLEKARSSKMYITLSLQSIDQIVSSSQSNGEAMANAILDTCANFIFHDGSGHDTAQKMSKIIGESDHYVYRTTSKTERNPLKIRIMSVDKAMVSKDIETDWLVPPKKFQSLSAPKAANGYLSTAYIINKSPDDERFVRSGGALARMVHVIVPEDTAAGVPNSFKRDIFIETETPQSFDAAEKLANKILGESEIAKNEGDWEIVDIGDQEEVVEGFVGVGGAMVQPVDELEKEVPEELMKSTDDRSENRLDMFMQLQQGNKKTKEVPKEVNKGNSIKLPQLD